MNTAQYRRFAAQGFYCHSGLFTEVTCQSFLREACRSKAAPLDWGKGHAPVSRAFYEMAAHPRILEVVEELLGPNIMLWGASIVERAAGVEHPWHSDIESAASGHTVSVWIGLEHTNKNSSLIVIPYSHAFGKSVQEVSFLNGKTRKNTTVDDIVSWAREFDPRCSLVATEINNGDALFFHGQIWHGSRNLNQETRRALLLQYATPQTAIRIPDYNYVDWPYRQRIDVKPACLMIRGNDNSGINRIVPAPQSEEVYTEPGLKNLVHPLDLPLATDPHKGHKPYPINKGVTADLDFFSCHISALAKGVVPHPPHAHNDEEILIVLSGEADLLLLEGDSPHSGTAPSEVRIKPLQMVYYPAGFRHTIRGASDVPVNYLMMKWESPKATREGTLSYAFYDLTDFLKGLKGEEGFQFKHVFEGPTEILRKLHAHVSLMKPGGGYDVHADSYDVAVVMLEGEAETLGRRIKPFDFIFYRAGEPHGMRNLSGMDAKYVVFEFHAGGGTPAIKNTEKINTLRDKALNPHFWYRSVRYYYKRIGQRFNNK